MPEMFDEDVVGHTLSCLRVSLYDESNPDATFGHIHPEDVGHLLRTMRTTQVIKTLGDSRRMCSCDLAASHSFRCEATPIFAELVYDLAERPGYVDPLFDDPRSGWYDVRWVCHGDDRAEQFHTGGSVNSPEYGHWCPVVNRWLEWGP